MDSGHPEADWDSSSPTDGGDPRHDETDELVAGPLGAAAAAAPARPGSARPARPAAGDGSAGSGPEGRERRPSSRPGARRARSSPPPAIRNGASGHAAEAAAPDPERDEDRTSGSGPRPTIHRRVFPPDHVDEDALKVLRRLHRHGYKAYLVGGGVRDLLLGRKPKDFDVATSARPPELRSLFRNCRIIGRRFRLAHILFGGGKVIETATFRRDPSAPEPNGDDDAFEGSFGGSDDADAAGAIAELRTRPRDEGADLLIRNDNVFGEPHEDAVRRDFTINGLFYDVERGEVIDYVGGLRDLDRRAINTIGLPDVRFREDPVRILRAIKFSARLDLGIDPEVYDAMVAQREELRRAAKPRLLEEILRLLRGGAAHRSIWLAWELGVLTVVLPELAVFLDDDAPRSRSMWGRLDAIDASIAAGRVPSDAVLLAAMLLGPVEEAMEGASDPSRAYEDFMDDVTESLAVPRRIKDRMRALVVSQRRLRGRGAGTLAHRDFYAEAVQLRELECAARGLPPPDLAVPEGLPRERESTGRRRRGRRGGSRR
jgi:poly(A) polymerase